jgi:hypothetical protein
VNLLGLIGDFFMGSAIGGGASTASGLTCNNRDAPSLPGMAREPHHMEACAGVSTGVEPRQETRMQQSLKAEKQPGTSGTSSIASRPG